MKFGKHKIHNRVDGQTQIIVHCSDYGNCIFTDWWNTDHLIKIHENNRWVKNISETGTLQASWKMAACCNIARIRQKTAEEDKGTFLL